MRRAEMSAQESEYISFRPDFGCAAEAGVGESLGPASGNDGVAAGFDLHQAIRVSMGGHQTDMNTPQSHSSRTAFPHIRL